MHRLPKSFAPLPDHRAPEFRSPETSRIPTGVHGAPGHFSPDVVRGREVTSIRVTDVLKQNEGDRAD
jgi:hypothetical protein